MAIVKFISQSLCHCSYRNSETAAIIGIVIAAVVPFICIDVCITIICVAVCTGACYASGSWNSHNVTMTTTVEPSVSVTTPSLHEPELKSPPNQYELQPYPEVPDVPGEPVKEVHIPVYPSPAYSTGYPQPPPKY